jgi:hypothetical protein
MTQPEGFIDQQNARKVCRLMKSIYGLKQESRRWNLHFDEEVKSFGFSKMKKNHVFTRKLVGAHSCFWSCIWMTYY